MIAASRIGVRRLFAVTVLAAAFAAWEAERAGSGAVDPCRGATSGRTKVGTLTRILHTSVYIGGRYRAAAPCDLFALDELRTDSRGEAVLRLTVRGRVTACAVFQRAKLSIYSPTTSPRVITFSAGRTWCSTTANVESPFVAVQAKLSTSTTIFARTALFAVEVDSGSALVKVKSGTVRVEQARKVEVKSNQAVLVSPTGKITGPQQARFDATDALALARLR